MISHERRYSLSLDAGLVDVHPPMHTYKPERFSVGSQTPPESQFIAQSNSLLLSNPTLWLLLPYNISLPSSPVKNFSCGAKARITVCPTYKLPFCALLDRVPRAYASFFVPFLQIFEVYSFSTVDAIILLVADMSAF